MRRQYRLGARAEKQEATRRRIVEAIAKLHSDVGPAATTITAIAEAAKVERLTVYRHFPTEASMYEACGSHWRVLHPRPNPESWMSVSDPVERLRLALTKLYEFYSDTEGMTANIIRDEQRLPELAKITNFRGWIDTLTDGVCKAWPPSERQDVLPALRLALDFNTWRLLVREMALTQREACGLNVQMVRCIGSGWKSPLASREEE